MKEYNECIEIVDLNSFLITGLDDQFVALVLFALVERLNKHEEMSSYEFDVICFGGHGSSYPAIGVVYLAQELERVEDRVKEEYYKMIRLLTLKDFIEISRDKFKEVIELILDIKRSNEEKLRKLNSLD